MWAAIARAIGAQADDLPQFGSIACPALVIVGEQDKPFLAPSRAMADAIPARDSSSSPTPGTRRSSRIRTRGSRRCASSSRCASPRRNGRARRPARRRGAAGARRRRDVHVVGRASVRALRRRGAGRPASRRHAARADRDVRSRGLGEGDATVGLRRAHRRPRRHERRQRDDRGRHERHADGGDRRSRAPAPLGLRLAAGARPRPDRRVGREARRDRGRRGSIVARVARRVCRGAHAAPRSDVRRHPARRVRARFRRPPRSRRRQRARVGRGARQHQGGRRVDRRGANGQSCSRAATCTGRTPRNHLSRSRKRPGCRCS